MSVRSRKLGRRQREALDKLKEQHTYYKGCGWVYNSHSETVEVLLSLVSSGFVVQNDRDGLFEFTFVSEPQEETSVQQDSNEELAEVQ